MPTFRSSDGRWQVGDDLQSALQINEYMSKPRSRKIVWDWVRSLAGTDPEPSAAHMALKKLDDAGALLGVLTQNIDSLELKAGVDPARVWQIHGSLDKAYCARCHASQPMSAVLDRLRVARESGATVAEAFDGELRCREWNYKKGKPCNGLLKPGFVFYGEQVRQGAWNDARAALLYADELWCVGTSLQVWPAADLPCMAASLGKTVRVVSTGAASVGGVGSGSWEKISKPADEALPELVGRVLAG